MVARSESMFGCYDSYSYRLWSLANVWNTCQLPPLNSGLLKEDDLNTNSDYFIKCPQCHKGCQTFQALKEHMEAVHADLASSENGTLSIPSAVSPTPTMIGTGGPFGCSQCTTSFTTKDQLEKHELLHSPNAQVSCKICNKTFANVYRLQRHMISHDESAVLRKFKCTECEKAFKFKHHLKEHIRIHSGEKPFKCGNCGKRFSHSGSYSSHMTSKKCLVMNLKLGRTRTPSTTSLLDKNSQPAVRGPKRSNVSPINNNITSSPNHNSYLPILPKYSEAAAAFLQSSLAGNPSLSPFYLAPPSLLNTTHAISPYSMPSLGHLLEQFQLQQQQNASSPLRPPILDNQEHSEDIKPQETNVNFVKIEPTEEIPKSNSSSCGGDLIMDEDLEQESEQVNVVETPSQNVKEDTQSSNHTSNGDLEAVKRILETVNATVTKELLQANMQKMSSETLSDSQSVSSPHNQPTCNHCRKSFESSSQLEDHECIDVKSEGLAAKLEDAITTKSDDLQNGSVSGAEDQDYDRSYHHTDDMDCESVTTTDHVSEDGRKVRVRSLISDEQLKILKDNYKLNPRPKREDLEKIASMIGFPVRVVQVWFQNTRARDRREGRLIQVPYSPAVTGLQTHRYPMVPTQTLTSNSNSTKLQFSTPSHDISEQPLDLSTKKCPTSNESSPASSPKRPTSTNHLDGMDEVVNLSRKSSRSPTPYLPSYQNHYQNSNSSEPRQSPSPLEFNNSRLAQILAQPAHKLSAMGLVPMEQLIQFGSADLPSLSQLINSSRLSSLSPNSRKRTWSENRDLASSDTAMMMDDDGSGGSKSRKVQQYVLKSLGSPVLGGQESEAEGQFSCDQCDKSFSKQSSLARHKYEHSGQRPHKCDECPKAFKHKHHLTEHKRLHSGEKPFQCSKCLKRFSHSGSYSQHMNHRYSYCKPYRE